MNITMENVQISLQCRVGTGAGSQESGGWLSRWTPGHHVSDIHTVGQIMGKGRQNYWSLLCDLIDNLNIRTVTEKKLLPVLGRFNVPSAVESEGTLSQSVSEPASRMEVEWNTGVVGQDHIMFSNMEYVIIDTDYVSRALVCSCQDLNLGFFAVNRRTCDFLVVSINNSSVPN